MSPLLFAPAAVLGSRVESLYGSFFRFPRRRFYEGLQVLGLDAVLSADSAIFQYAGFYVVVYGAPCDFHYFGDFG